MVSPLECSSSVLSLENAALRHYDASRGPSTLLLVVEVAAKAPGQSQVARHDRHPLRMDRSQIGVLEQPNHVHLGRLLKCVERLALELQVVVVLVCDLAHEPLERELPEEQIRALLELLDLTNSLGPRAPALRFRLTDNCTGALACSLRCQGLPSDLSRTLRLHSDLLRAGHLHRKQKRVC